MHYAWQRSGRPRNIQHQIAARALGEIELVVAKTRGWSRSLISDTDDNWNGETERLLTLRPAPALACSSSCCHDMCRHLTRTSRGSWIMSPVSPVPMLLERGWKLIARLQRALQRSARHVDEPSRCFTVPVLKAHTKDFKIKNLL